MEFIKKMKISVIIPVYKTEKYLDKCLQGVFEQTYKDLEIILVDDGSPDGCPQLCDDYAKSDARIKVIHNKINEGAAEARNAGLRAATGEYIIFLDADDFWIDKNGLIKMVQVFQKDSTLDIVFFNIQLFLIENTQRFIKHVKQYDLTRTTGDRNTVFLYLTKIGFFISSPCTQMIKRNLIINNAVFFEKGLFCEDMDWKLSLWQQIKSVSALNLNMYCCRIRWDSTSNEYKIQQSRDYMFILKKWINMSVEDKQFQSIAKIYLADLYASFYRHFFMINRQYRVEIYTELKQMKSILLSARTKKALLAKYTTLLLGFNLSVRLWGLYGLLRKRGIKGLKLIFHN